MLLVSLCLVGAAALLGASLAVWYLKGDGHGMPHWALGAVHAALALAGLVLLLIVLGGPPRGVTYGGPQMGEIAAGCLVVAALIGLIPLSYRLRRRRQPLSSLVIGMHATIAITGLVILAGFFTLVG